MAHPEPRMIVELLLQGERHPEDLDRLFSHLKGKTKGRFPAVKDIGDFQSHIHERDSGLLHDRALRFHDMMKVAPLFESSHALTLEDIARSNRAALEVVGGKIRDYCGIKYSRATELLDLVLSDLEPDGAGGFVMRRTLTSDEHKLMRALQSCPKPSEVLTQDELFKQLTECLMAEGLLQESDLSAFSALSDWVAVYALSRIHYVDILRRKGGEKVASLMAMTDSETGKLAVYTTVEWGRLRPVRLAFLTNCEAADWCTSELLDTTETLQSHGQIQLKAHWEFPIRLNADGKLVPRREIDKSGVERSLYVRERPKGRG